MPPNIQSDRPFILDSPTGAALSVRHWRPVGPVRAVLLVQHGLAEHSARYARLGRELADAGIATFAHDHRGHGSTTAIDAPLRRFAGRGGAAKIIRDAHAVRVRAEAEHADAPIFMLGHSLGGTIALNYARRFAEGLSGLLVWNAGTETGWQARFGALAVKAEKALKGSDVASDMFRRATFDAWARSIMPRRTTADWLSHDPAAVDTYLADPLCGWTPTVSMVEDILVLLRDTATHKALADLPHRLPIQCLGGSEDPATNNGASVRALAQRLTEAGARSVETQIMKGARHETLQEAEPMRSEAIDMLVRFIEKHRLEPPSDPTSSDASAHA